MYKFEDCLPYSARAQWLAILILLSWFAPSPAAAAQGDIVLYASDVSTMTGTWQRVSSTTGAGGQLMNSPDSGGMLVSSPLASPANYFEASFSATANTPYHVWLRLRATSDSASNDSVWVQFSDALDTSGSAVWRIGSSSALLVGLQSCDGCGLSGWGWQDNVFWLSDYPVVKFATTGTHKLRIQMREDGVQLDQIVLSPTAFFNAAPGALQNDTTIVPKSTTSTTPSVAPAEVVLYASGATRRNGNWALENDATAAYGTRLGSQDYSEPKVVKPLATPADYIEWTFTAVAGTRYRTWLRLNAASNLPQNGSVYVQFSDSVTASGASTYGIGTTSGLAVGLEACNGCGVSGWGWRNTAYWTNDTGDVYFATGGTKTIRVQTREDGVRLDQIVISPAKYVNSSPGAVRDDNTLVLRDGTKAVISTSSSSSSSTSTTTASYPQTLTFTASTDNDTLVLSYRLDLFKAGVNPATTSPSSTLNLGKPAVVSGQITVNIGSTVQGLASGSYFATVTAIGSAGSSRSAPSATFTR